MPSWVVKLVFYLFNKSARSIFLTADSRDHTKAKNKQKICKKYICPIENLPNNRTKVQHCFDKEFEKQDLPNATPPSLHDRFT